MSKAKVYRRGQIDWAWHHACPGQPVGQGGGLHFHHAGALAAALRHMKRCAG